MANAHWIVLCFLEFHSFQLSASFFFIFSHFFQFSTTTDFFFGAQKIIDEYFFLNNS